MKNDAQCHGVGIYQLWDIITKQKLLILFITLIAASIGIFLAWRTPPLYFGNVLIEIGEVVNYNYNPNSTKQSTVIQNLDDINNLKEITLQATGVNVSIPMGTSKILNLSLEHTNPSEIKLKLDNAIDFIIARHQEKIQFYGNADSKIHMTQVIGNMNISTDPIKPNKRLIITISTICGLIIGIMGAFFIEFFTFRRNTKKDHDALASSDY